MKKILRLFASLTMVSLITASCGGGGSSDPSVLNDPNQPQAPDVTLTNPTAVKLAGEFWANQKQLRILAASLLSAFSPKGNGGDLNYCGGAIGLTENNPDFNIAITDYCVNAVGQQVVLNGSILGTIESGANFTAQIPQITVVGDGVNLVVKGSTRNGRADDMFISLTIDDLIHDTQLVLEDISIKKGELDFGYITFPEIGRVEFKVITHFNSELTQGQIFFYGANGDLLIISADNGALTAVYKTSKLDSGVLLDTPCNG